jgi:hypothetical protein
MRDNVMTRPTVGRVMTRVTFIVPLVIALSITAGCTTTTTTSPTVTATSTVAATPMVTATPTVTATSRVPLSTRLLTGPFVVPSGFTVGSINPLVPADSPPFGEVTTSVTSPGGVAYNVLFSPVVVPCGYAACTSKTTTLAVGDAAPAYAAVTFDPALNAPAKCGYSEASEVACDAIHGKEYIAVRGSGTRISTADAVVILRAALAYLRQSGG